MVGTTDDADALASLSPDNTVETNLALSALLAPPHHSPLINASRSDCHIFQCPRLPLFIPPYLWAFNLLAKI